MKIALLEYFGSNVYRILGVAAVLVLVVVAVSQVKAEQSSSIDVKTTTPPTTSSSPLVEQQVTVTDNAAEPTVSHPNPGKTVVEGQNFTATIESTPASSAVAGASTETNIQVKQDNETVQNQTSNGQTTNSVNFTSDGEADIDINVKNKVRSKSNIDINESVEIHSSTEGEDGGTSVNVRSSNR